LLTVHDRFTFDAVGGARRTTTEETRMPAEIDAPTLKAWLSDGGEIALFDVREHGQYGTGHPFFSVPLPYSRFEIELPKLAPNAAVRAVLCDGGDGVAGRAAARAAALGYRDVSILAGGAKAWGEAGYTLYAGVNVPSKVLGELVEHRRHTPRVSAQDVVSMRAAKENFVIVDGRPFAEYRKMNIPGGICCPNGELVLRIRGIAPDPNTKIVVNCAGRTRSIIGAQTLIDFGVRVRARERHAGLVPGRARTRTRRQPPLC
jgi:rhodanese-related sulfurtransferase